MLKPSKQTLSMRMAAIVFCMACALSATAQTAPEGQAGAAPPTATAPPATDANPAATGTQPVSAPEPAAQPDATPPASSPSSATTAPGSPAAVPFATSIPLTPEAAAIKKRLEERFPTTQIRNVSKSGYFDLYEAQFDGQMIYTDVDVKYVFLGNIFDASTRENLTEVRARKLNRIAWDSLPFDLAMKKVKGNGTRKLVVFSDADCPFCARLEKELKTVDDVTIYTFLFPIDSLHPDAARKSKIIWCSPDRVKAWDEFYATGKLPNNKGDCDTPLPQTLALGHQLRVNATPTLVFADGSMIPGALPKDRLEAELAQADVEAKKLAAAKASKQQ